MSPMTRREFLKKTATDAALAGLMTTGAARAFANPLGLPIGSQTYPHRARIAAEGLKGFDALLKDMKEIGIEAVELCNASGYKEFAALSDAIAKARADKAGSHGLCHAHRHAEACGAKHGRRGRHLRGDQLPWPRRQQVERRTAREPPQTGQRSRCEDSGEDEEHRKVEAAAMHGRHGDGRHGEHLLTVIGRVGEALAAERGDVSKPYGSR